MTLGIFEAGVAELVEEEALPEFLVIVCGRIIGLAGQTGSLEMTAVAVRTILSEQAHLIDNSSLDLGDAVIEINLFAAWSL
jgi:hypothetical protein